LLRIMHWVGNGIWRRPDPARRFLLLFCCEGCGAAVVSACG
jgi:hypothetical protein